MIMKYADVFEAGEVLEAKGQWRRLSTVVLDADEANYGSASATGSPNGGCGGTADADGSPARHGNRAGGVGGAQGT